MRCCCLECLNYECNGVYHIIFHLLFSALRLRVIIVVLVWIIGFVDVWTFIAFVLLSIAFVGDRFGCVLIHVLVAHFVCNCFSDIFVLVSLASVGL